jgi:hypothetical protein
LFPNEASNYQVGEQFVAVAGFVLERAAENDWDASYQRNGCPNTAAVMRNATSYSLSADPRTLVKLSTILVFEGFAA